MGHVACSLGTEPGGEGVAVVSADVALPNYLFVCSSLAGLRHKPVGLQSDVVQEPAPVLGVLTAGALDVESKPFTLPGKAEL